MYILFIYLSLGRNYIHILRLTVNAEDIKTNHLFQIRPTPATVETIIQQEH